MTQKSEFGICPMAPGDLDEVMQLELQSFTAPWSRESLESDLRSPFARYFVLRKDGALLGYAGVHTLFGEMTIVSIASSPAARRQGVAQALLDHLFAAAKVGQVRVVLLEVREGNAAARAFYEKNGFAYVGRRPGYYERPVEDALLMTLEL